MRVARDRQALFGLGTVQRDPGDVTTQFGDARQLFLQPQPRGDQHLVVAAAAGVDLAAGIAQAFGEPRASIAEWPSS